MQEELIPSKVQLIAKRGFDRMLTYRRATAMFVKEYVGKYYRDMKGMGGEEPINLIFRAVSSLVPNLVMESPVNEVITDFISHKQYAELLSLALNSVDRQIKLKDILRGWITSALFGWGIIKVGLAAQGHMIKFGDINVDPGQVYAELIDLDDFCLDPVCTDINKASFLGHRTMVPRQLLLDDDSYDHDLVMQLPRVTNTANHQKVSDISQKNMGGNEIHTLQDNVYVVELFVPKAEALVTIPDPNQIRFDKYIGMKDYYGPAEGPYVFLSFTPPVLGNPLPVAPVSVWFDLHRMANRSFTKTMDQADRQKDILLYPPAQADEAEAIKDAEDGDAIASTNPKEINIASFGGQNRNNEQMLQQLQVWFNYMSGNPDQLAGNMTPGTKGSKETATRTSILQSNANISVEDARSILYDRTAEVNRRLAFYLHTDPLIEIPLTKRSTGGQMQQLFLTPEQRQGDFLEFIFKIVQRSMSRLDPQIRAKRIETFCVNVLPAAANTALMLMQIGQPFNIQRYLTRIGHEMGIGEWVQDLFDDPEFIQKLEIMMAMGPQNAGKAGEGGSSSGNKQPNQPFPGMRNVMSPGQESNQFAQDIAADSQSQNWNIF